MFSSMELMLIVLVTLLVIGPERLPETMRTIGLWIGRLSRSFTSMKVEIEQEIGMDDVRRQLHNESVMAQMKQIEDEVKNSIEPPVMQEPPADPVTAAATAIEIDKQVQSQSPAIDDTASEADDHSPKKTS
ncbi:Sec-independent protein translocase protein TatB [Gammaproteobacteria bacterium]|nr:Sec-independent protein translocase protein TatB [Gammaproteobacteria bacterium]